MSSVQNKQTIKLRLLALVLALALVWYSLNPVPKPIIRKKRETEPPDEKRRNAELQSMPVTLPVAVTQIREIAEPLSFLEENEDNFEWPEFING
jgi:hypothetical protein